MNPHDATKQPGAHLVAEMLGVEDPGPSTSPTGRGIRCTAPRRSSSGPPTNSTNCTAG